MSDINTIELISVLSSLQHNYTALVQYWYDIFYNQTPKEVSIDFYDKEGKVVVITIDNLAKIKESMGGISGKGEPSPTLKADFGTLYHDTDSGDLYRFAKDIASADDTDGYWDKIITSDILDSIIIKNDDPVEHNVAVTDGVLFLSRDTQKLYIGRNGAWERIDASPSLVNRDEFKVASGDTSVVTDGLILSAACENKNTVEVFIDGVLLKSDAYDISGNGFVLKFKEPLTSPEEGKSIEVVVRYFTNLSLYEEYWEEEEVTLDDGTVVKHKKFAFAKDLFETLQKITNRLTELLNQSTGMQSEIDNLDAEIEDLKAKLTDAVSQTVGDVTKEVREIANSVKNEKSAILSLHNSVKGWYDQVSVIRNEIASTQTDISEDVLWLKQIFTDPETGAIDLKKFVFIDDFTSKMSSMTNDYTSKITELRTSLTTRINNNEGRISVMESNIESAESRIEANEQGIETLNENLVKTEEKLRKECFSENNYPIDFMTSIKNNRNLYAAISETASEGASPKYAITLSLSRDISYYTIDLTDDLTTHGADKIYKQFIINNTMSKDDLSNIDYNEHNVFVSRTGIEDDLLDKIATAVVGDTVVDGNYTLTLKDYDSTIEYVRENSTHYEVGDMFNIAGNTQFSFQVTEETIPTTGETEDTYVIQGRVMLINNSIYRPRIIWENTGISWLGGEEPDLEPQKTYLLEFISYDYGTTWYAHTLGICQPSIYVGDLVRTFDITIDNFDSADLGMACDVFYDKEDGVTYYAGTYTIDNGGVLKDVELVFGKKELGDSFSNFRVHKASDGLFMKHLVQGYNVLVDDEIAKETVSINDTDMVTDKHTYSVTITSDDFVNPNVDVDIILGRMNGDTEETLTLATVQGLPIYDSSCEVRISSEDEISAFIGCDEIAKTTPWYLKKVVATYKATYEDPKTGETVVSSTTTYSSDVETPLTFDGASAIYLQKDVVNTDEETGVNA